MNEENDRCTTQPTVVSFGNFNKINRMNKKTNTIGARIRSARESAGLTQNELGRLLRVSGQSVQAWEVDKAVPRQQRFGALAQALEVDAEWLLLGEDLDDTTEAEDLDLGRISHEEGHLVNLLRQLTLEEQLAVRTSLEEMVRNGRTRRKRRGTSGSGSGGVQEAGQEGDHPPEDPRP